MYINFEQVAISNAVKTLADLTVPANATKAELMGTTAIRYTMDNVIAPTTSKGMILRATDPPKTFLIEDVKRIKFIRNAAADTTLEIHYFGGRDV